MLVSDFEFELPPELIAQQARARGASRMLLFDPCGPRFEHASFDAFPEQLHAGDVLVLNDTAVLPARLLAQPKGNMTRQLEVLLTRELEPLRWEAWCKPARRVRGGDTLTFSESFSAKLEEKRTDGSVVVRFECADEQQFRDLLEQHGAPPLPPYIRREKGAGADDRERYQTVYASRPGAVAAPTAGLHFTDAILQRIADRGVEIVRLTLHVGIGTFKPVKVERVTDHQMDTERYQISDQAAAALNLARQQGRRIVAVGTTSTRALESSLAGTEQFEAGEFETGIFITPGYRFRAVDALLTNFHLPQSTLLMLVSAFAGMPEVRAAYAAAIAERYFFYSYGDCMFISRRRDRCD